MNHKAYSHLAPTGWNCEQGLGEAAGWECEGGAHLFAAIGAPQQDFDVQKNPPLLSAPAPPLIHHCCPRQCCALQNISPMLPLNAGTCMYSQSPCCLVLGRQCTSTTEESFLHCHWCPLALEIVGKYVYFSRNFFYVFRIHMKSAVIHEA
jgi:hypothetical protein